MKQRGGSLIPCPRILQQWLPIDTLSFASEFSTRPGISKMTFARIVLPRVLPVTCGRALYLDGDILVLDALEELWNIDLGDAVLGAVPDYYQDSVASNGPSATSGPQVKRYFNAGVLLIHLAKWRNERLSEKALEYLDRFPTAEYSDQDALNSVCNGQWKVLEPTWNFFSSIPRKRSQALCSSKSSRSFIL